MPTLIALLAGCTTTPTVDDPVNCRMVRETTLPTDCRCYDNLYGDPACRDPDLLPSSTRVADGPSLMGLKDTHVTHIYGGFVDADERLLYAGIGLDSSAGNYQGLVLGVNLDTGDRHVVSGTFPNEATVGAGDPLPAVRAVERGPDGKLYAYAEDAVHMSIWRIDPATGDRTRLWTDYDATQVDTNDPASGQCDNGHTGPGIQKVQVSENGFVVHDSGDFLIPVVPGHAGADETPGGLVRIAKDGSTCTWASRWGGGTNNTLTATPVGTGPASEDTLTALEYRPSSGQLWGIGFFGHFFVIDPATGDREIAFDVRGGLGTYSIDVDEEGSIIVLGGTDAPASFVTAVDVEQGRIIDLTCVGSSGYDDYGCMGDSAQGPLGNCCQAQQPTWFDPTTRRYILAHREAVFIWGDAATGNNVVFSM